MDQLERAFEKFFERLLFVVLLAAIVLAQNHWVDAWCAPIHDGTLRGYAEDLIEFAIPIAVIGFGTRAFRRWLWKVYSPELNFGGRWIGVSDYDESVEVASGDTEGLQSDEEGNRPPRPLLTVVEFEQEMSSARLINGRAVYPSGSSVRWYSTSLTIHQGPPLEIQISYLLIETHRPTVNAIENIAVFPSRQKRRWRNLIMRQYRYPQMLQGRFEHAWNGQARFLHRGDTYYARVSEDEFKQVVNLSHRQGSCATEVIDLANLIAPDDEDLSYKFKGLLIKCLGDPITQDQSATSLVGDVPLRRTS